MTILDPKTGLKVDLRTGVRQVPERETGGISGPMKPVSEPPAAGAREAVAAGLKPVGR